MSDERLSIREAAKREGVSYQTIWRWITSGVSGVRIEPQMRGGRAYVTAAQLDEMARAITEKRAERRRTVVAVIRTTNTAAKRRLKDVHGLKSAR